MNGEHERFRMPIDRSNLTPASQEELDRWIKFTLVIDSLSQQLKELARLRLTRASQATTAADAEADNTVDIREKYAEATKDIREALMVLVEGLEGEEFFTPEWKSE